MSMITIARQYKIFILNKHVLIYNSYIYLFIQLDILLNCTLSKTQEAHGPFRSPDYHVTIFQQFNLFHVFNKKPFN